MKSSNTILAILAAGIVASGAFFTPAQAACKNSVWIKSMGNGLANTIKGRDCNGNLSVRMLGIVDTGWITMQVTGLNTLGATYVDNNVTTKIKMLTSGNAMNVIFEHIDNNGAVSFTQANYSLSSYQ